MPEMTEKLLVEICDTMMTAARANLERDGMLENCAILFLPTMEPVILPLQWGSKQEKLIVMAALRDTCKLMNAVACVTIFDAWMARLPAHLTADEVNRKYRECGGVQQMDGSIEAIVIVGYGTGIRILHTQPYMKQSSGPILWGKSDASSRAYDSQDDLLDDAFAPPGAVN